MIKVLKLIFHISVLSLIVLSLYPGSIIGFLLYGDFGLQPNLIKNPFGTSINHFFSYFCVSIFGLLLYSNLKKEKFQKFALGLLFLSAILEILQHIVPNRSFEWVDLIFNILGVLVAYILLKIYLLIKKT